MEKVIQENFNKHKPIIIYYISIYGLRSEDIENYINKVQERILISSIECEAIVLPVQGETRIECINPIYIKDEDLIKKHERLMSELHEHLNYQINELNK